jgi:regulator of replication initiation timing|eukprot:CAMPEP_0204898194 /NCGR_PEP_ID=MMETSP1397-20131031/1145_1 /ASSEMBLY_ACC=CAM_ASM_000891 /TAXON_ID=49980 /ORGANISM="Climacostomum Climacostomum virens, Strain Stock W-24" /LENGTH=73 /DNA_ID=CAMNT_0052065999 /DNA_START=359 /DNA_END=580 /DNA_ORIENTATION=-
MAEERDLNYYGRLDKEELIESILQLQQTLQDLTSRIEHIRNDNQSLRDENIILKEYINNLMIKAGNLGSENLS